ncbi:hypothetical protein Tco_0504806 [Tanacetum coccineum]
MDYLRTTEAELGIDLDRTLCEHDPLDRLNDLANKKRKHADDIHDFFRANKRLKILLPLKTLKISQRPCYILYRLYHGPGLDDHARTLLKSLKVLQRQIFRSLEDWEVSSLQFMQRTELVTPDLICPSIYQLLRSSGTDSGPDMSFDKSTSPECLFGLARASLAEVSKLIPHGSISNSSYSACPKIPYHWEMKQLCDASEYDQVLLDTKEYTYTVDMFRVILHFPVETPENLFVAPVNIQTIEAFMNRVGYQGVVDKNSVPTDDFKEYETVFVGLDVLKNQPKLVVYSQGMHRSTPRAHMTPTLTAAIPQTKKRNQIAKKLVHHKNHNRLEPKIYKGNPEHVDDDDDKEEEKVDELKGDETGSLEFRTEKMQTPIPTPPRSPRIN